MSRRIHFVYEESRRVLRLVRKSVEKSKMLDEVDKYKVFDSATATTSDCLQVSISIVPDRLTDGY